MLTNPFLKAMSICEGTVSILDAGCVVYSRIWCIYEVYMSVMGGNSSYEFDVYTKIDGDKAIGITHGCMPIDKSESRRKKRRERNFPLERILVSTKICVENAVAEKEADREMILNMIAGRIDELNNMLRGIFVAPALERIIKERDIDTIKSCLKIVKASNAKIIGLDLLGCTEFNDEILIELVNSLPPTLAIFRLYSKGSAVTGNTINTCLKNIIKCPQLVRLKLSDNNINADGAGILADALKFNKTLKTLKLNKNQINDDGAKKLTNSLKDNSTLKQLYMKENSIDNHVKERIKRKAKGANHKIHLEL
jgi:hypothetical protein